MPAVYNRAPDGSELVDAFIEGLRDPDRQAALDAANKIDVLERLQNRRADTRRLEAA
jgi:hypothetical protein